MKKNLKAHTCTVSLNQDNKQKGRLQRYMIRLTSCVDIDKMPMKTMMKCSKGCIIFLK